MSPRAKDLGTAVARLYDESQIIYFKFMPDFPDKYAAYMIEQARAAGESAQKIQAIADEMKSMKATLNNPFLNAAFTFIEPFPIGLIVTLISAAILRKKPRPPLNDAVAA